MVVHGYLGTRSDITTKLSFVSLTNESLDHSVQIISKSSSEASKPLHELLKSLGPGIPVVVEGVVAQKVKPKEAPLIKPDEPLKNEDVEIALSAIHVANDFPDSQFYKDEAAISPPKRHLQLRASRRLRNALAYRADAMKMCTDLLVEAEGFLHVETPLLFKSTPEGAREFLVPTRHKGRAYALPQSPQQYKQILMASGIPRYFQFARCFRDEDLRADRQPEFTQLDLEMSFSRGSDVMEVVERLIPRLCSTLLPGEEPADGRFPQLSYTDAMARYGSDKPDTRLGMEIMQVGHLLPVDLTSKIGPIQDPIVDCFKITVGEEAEDARNFINDFMDSPEARPFIENPDGQPGIFVFDSRKPLGGLFPFGFEAAERLEEDLELQEGDVVVIQARKNAPFSGGSTAAGRLRLAMHKAAVAQDLVEKPEGWHFLWVNQFPLFSPITDEDPGQGGAAGIASTHHPFTAPASREDAELMAMEPLKAKADHYDLVLNGVELGGGSRRIHNAEAQEYVLREVLKMSDERVEDFRHLLDVLRDGCPPHAGFALGFDRLVATMLGEESIRNVIAFPKSGSGEDMLVKSPNALTQAQLDTYHLALKGS